MPKLPLSDKNLQSLVPKRCWEQLYKCGCPEYGSVSSSSVKFRLPYLFEVLDWLSDFKGVDIFVFFDDSAIQPGWRFRLFLNKSCSYMNRSCTKTLVSKYAAYTEAILEVCKFLKKVR